LRLVDNGFDLLWGISHVDRIIFVVSFRLQRKATPVFVSQPDFLRNKTVYLYLISVF
jgi:hypothetical protein